MIGLPEPLRRWSTELEVFPLELALALGPHIRRLDAMVGPLRPRTSVVGDAPDGFSGLSRRGPYERLLTSEWLVADELPDEFLRRAAMNEHAFFELAVRTPASRDASFALFDAGPAQLGAPRLVQLATLIVLARRAGEAGVPFSWGVLQQPDVALTSEVTESSVLRLLGARTTESINAAELQAWRNRFGRTDDVWIVGAPPELPVAASRVDLEEEIERDSADVHVHVRPLKGEARSTKLTPPNESDGARLLRDPFARKVPVDATPMRLPKISPVSRLFFGQNGRSLFLKLVDGAYALVPVPNSPRAKLGKPRIVRIPKGHQLVGINVQRKRPVLATWFEGRLRMGESEEMLQSTDALELRGATFHAGLPTPMPCFADNKSSPIWRILDSEGSLYEVNRDTGPWGSSRYQEANFSCLTASARDGSFWRIGHSDRQYRGIRIERPGPDMKFDLLARADGVPPQAFLGCGTGGISEAPWVAIRTGETTWLVGWAARCDEKITVGERDTVYGVIAINSRPGLLVVHNQRSLRLQTAAGSTAILEEASAIRFAVTDPIQPQLAYRTDRGELVIYRYDKGFRRVLRVASGEAS